EQWLFSNPQEFTQICFDSDAQVVLIEPEDLRLQRSTRKGAQEHVALGRASGKLHAAKRTRDQRSLFNERHDKTESIQRMLDRCSPVREVDRRRGSVFDLSQFLSETIMCVIQQRRCNIGGHRQTNAIRLELLTLIRGYRPSLILEF